MHPSVPIVAPLLVLFSAVQGAEMARHGLPDRFAPEIEREDRAKQVSIEQRMTIRIYPRTVAPGTTPLDPDAPDDRRHRLVERKFGKCVAIGAILGVQPIGGRKLLLIMRDDRLITAELGKGCEVRDFYAGFIVAKNADALICAGRDELRSRSGTTCKVGHFRQLVERDE